jgi:hypothetical protein
MGYGADMTRTFAPLLLLALASCSPAPQGPEPQAMPLELAGRVPGPPQRCVDNTRLQSLRTSENNRHVLVYGGGRIIWANQLGQCRFGPDDILVTESYGSQYCRGDIVKSVDRTSRIPGPTCILSDFVPYSLPVR